MNIFVRVLYVLLAVAFTVLCYYVIIWVLGLLGVSIPDQILKICMVIIGILAVLGAIRGSFDNFWTPKV